MCERGSFGPHGCPVASTFAGIVAGPGWMAVGACWSWLELDMAKSYKILIPSGYD